MMNDNFTVDITELVEQVRKQKYYKYIAQDRDGDIFGYGTKPRLVGDEWEAASNDDVGFLRSGAVCKHFADAIICVDWNLPVEKKKHVHADLIKQWADGAKIQFLTDAGCWETTPNPAWLPYEQYRVCVEPDVRSSYALIGIAESGLIDIQGMYANENCGEYDSSHSFEHVGKLKVTFDAANKQLLSAEIVG